MARDFRLPDLGEGLTEAEIVKVLVREGEVIAEDAPLLEVETDKATVEIPSPMSGRVEKIHVEPNQTVKVGQVLVTFADAGAQAAKGTPSGKQAADTLDPTRTLAPEPRTPVQDGRARQAAPPEPPRAPARPGPVPATPATRRLARELGVDLQAVRATGAGGRQPLSHLRRTIAERMALSATVIPHVTHFDRADITELDAIIQRNLETAKARGVTLTLTAFLLKAAALALGEHPTFNATLDAAAGQLIVKRYVHLGIADATERGLIVPVLRDVDRKPVLEVARELGALAQRVRDGKAALDDLRGGTFTITNIGALGGTGAIPIINYPEVAILGVARARQEPVVREGRVEPRLLLPLSLTFDHRVADGADGARFAAAIVRRLERPEQLLLDL